MNQIQIKRICMLLFMGFLAANTAMAGEKSVTGTVEQTTQGIMISGEDGAIYMVQGKDLSGMIGKTVMATGTLAENRSGKTLTLISVEPVEE